MDGGRGEGVIEKSNLLEFVGAYDLEIRISITGVMEVNLAP